MAFKALDDNAVSLTDDSPVCSAVAQIIRGNVEAIRTDRFYKTGIGFHDDYPLRACSPGYPMPLLPLFVYVPQAHSRIRMEIRAASVERAGDSGDTDALRLFLTTASETTGFTMPPPDAAAWGASSAGSQVTLTASAQTIELKALSNAPPGWVGAVLWVWSTPRDTAINSGTITGYEYPYLVVLDSVSTADGVVEAGLWIKNAWNTNQGWGGSGTQEGELFGVGYWDRVGADPSEGRAFLVPPPRRSSVGTSQETWALHALSVIEIGGIMLEVEPDEPPLPAADAFATWRPLTATVYQPLIAGLQGLHRQRVKTLAPGVAARTSAGNQPLGVTAGTDLDRTILGTATWTRIQSVVWKDAPADDGGYTCIVCGVLIDYTNDATPTQLTVRLAGVGFDEVIDDSNEEDFDIVAVSTVDTNRGNLDAWDGRVLACQMQRHNTSWQYLGALLGRPGAWGAGLENLFYLTVTLDPDSLSYPCQINVDLQITGERSVAFYGTAAIAQRSRDIHGGA